MRSAKVLLGLTLGGLAVLGGTIASYRAGFRYGKEVGAKDAILLKENEIETYLGLPEEIRKFDTNIDGRFQYSEVRSMYDADIVEIGCFERFKDQSKDYVYPWIVLFETNHHTIKKESK